MQNEELKIKIVADANDAVQKLNQVNSQLNTTKTVASSAGQGFSALNNTIKENGLGQIASDCSRLRNSIGTMVAPISNLTDSLGKTINITTLVSSSTQNMSVSLSTFYDTVYGLLDLIDRLNEEIYLTNSALWDLDVIPDDYNDYNDEAVDAYIALDFQIQEMKKKVRENAKATKENAKATKENAKATKENAKATKENAEATKENAKATKEMAKAGDVATTSTKKLNTVISKVLSFFTPVLLVAAAIKTIMNRLSDTISLANIQQGAETKLATVMEQRMKASQDTVDAIKEQASALQEVGVIGDEVALAGASQFATFVNSKKAIEDMLPAMENLAAAMYGTDVSSANMTSIANMIGKAIANDSLSSLTKAGITVTDAELAQWKRLTTEEEKVAFLANVINNNVGRMNQALAQTYSGKMQQLSNAWGDVKERIGAICQQIASWFIPLLQSCINLVSYLANKITSAMKAFGLWDSSLEGGATGVLGENDEETNYTTALNDNTDAVKSATKAINGLASIDEINNIGSSSSLGSKISGNSSGGSIGTTATITTEVEDSNTIAEKIKKALKDAGDIFTIVIKTTIETASEFAKLYKQWFKDVWDLIGDDTKLLLSIVLPPNLSDIKKTIKETLESLKKEAVLTLSFALPVMTDITKVLTEFQKKLEIFIPIAFPTVAGCWKLLKLIIDKLKDKALKTTIWLTLCFPKVASMITSLRTSLALLRTALVPYSWFKLQIPIVTEKVSDIVNKVKSTLARVANSIGNGLMLSFGIQQNSNGSISSTKHALGGITSGVSTITVGESGREMILPLENNTQWMDVLANKITGSNGGNNNNSNQPIYITLDINGTKFGQVCANAINQANRQAGSQLLAI